MFLLFNQAVLALGPSSWVFGLWWLYSLLQLHPSIQIQVEPTVSMLYLFVDNTSVLRAMVGLWVYTDAILVIKQRMQEG